MIYFLHGSWHVRFREHTPTGIVRRSVRLQARTRRNARVEGAELLARVRRRHPGVPSIDPAIGLEAYVRNVYFPWAEKVLAPSTVKGYRDIWKVHPWDGVRRLRDVTPAMAQSWLLDLSTRRPDLTGTSLRHIKAFYSGVFAHARQLGLIRENPVQGTRLPRGQRSLETYAYTAQDVSIMLGILPEEAQLAIALCAYTGLRMSELQGLQWGDLAGDTTRNITWLNVSRSKWRQHVTEGKTGSSIAAVPVCGALAAFLGHPGRSSDPVLPQDLHNMAERTIRPLLRAIGLQWHGWHAFRRGLATRLHAQGVDDLTIQRLLRHSSVRVTQQHYIKTLDEKVRNAVEELK